MKQHGEYKGASDRGGFVYENIKTGERVVSGKPSAQTLPGKPEDWKYVGREH